MTGGVTLAPRPSGDPVAAPRPAAAPSRPGNGLRPDIQALRAFAVAAVLGYHAGVPGFEGGFVGVDAFFVISGFLITGHMVRQRATSSFRLAGFYARRVRRLLPAATLVIVATLVLSAWHAPVVDQPRIAGDATAAALFASNLRFASQSADYFQAGSAPSPFLQFWSLSLEEQFYLLWPAVFEGLWLLARRARQPRRFLAGTVAVLVAASFALSVRLTGAEPSQAFFLLTARWWELGLGALLALAAPRMRLAGASRGRLAAAGWAGLLASVLLIGPGTAFPGWAALAPTLAAAAVIVSGTGDAVTGAGARLVAARPFQAVGGWSYSLYLWHWPLLVLPPAFLAGHMAGSWPLRTGWMLVASVPIAVATSRFVEAPVRHHRSLVADTPRTLLVGAGLVAVSLAAVAVFTTQIGMPTTGTTVPATGGALGPRLVPRDVVPDNLSPGLMAPDYRYVPCGTACTFGAPASAGAPRVVLFGDSHAHHLAAAFDRASRAVPMRVTLASKAGCPSFDLPGTGKGGAAECRAWREAATARLLAHPPDLLVLSNHTTAAHDRDPRAWAAGVATALQRLSPHMHVVVVSQTPEAPEGVPRCLAEHLEDARRCDLAWPTAQDDQLATLSARAGATYLDLRPKLCLPGGGCPAITEDTLVYNDRDHLSARFSAALGPWLADRLQPVIDHPRAAP